MVPRIQDIHLRIELPGRGGGGGGGGGRMGRRNDQLVFKALGCRPFSCVM